MPAFLLLMDSQLNNSHVVPKLLSTENRVTTDIAPKTDNEWKLSGRTVNWRQLSFQSRSQVVVYNFESFIIVNLLVFTFN